MPENKRKINAKIPLELYDRISSAEYSSTAGKNRYTTSKMLVTAETQQYS